MNTVDQDSWKFIEDMNQDEREVLFLAMLFQGLREGIITGEMLIDMVVSKRLADGDVVPLIKVIRDGKINDLHHKTLELLADHLEGKLQKKPGPVKSHDRFCRNIEIINAFLELKDKHGYEKTLDMLADDSKFLLGKKAIEKIINDFNKFKKKSQLALKIIQ